MPKGPIITDAVKNRIARTYLDHPDWTAKDIQGEVHAQLLKGDPQIPPGWPGLSTVQKVLAPLRAVEAEMYSESKWLDRPWDVTTMAEDEIPPETLPTVLKMVMHFRQTLKRQMTIREVRWAARLSSVQNLRKLYDFILDYAQEEKLTELTGIVDEHRVVLEAELYMALTDKRSNEPVFDVYGMELPSYGRRMIQLGLEQDRQRRLSEEKNQKEEGNNERPHNQEG
jgi:hypothetical protein